MKRMFALCMALMLCLFAGCHGMEAQPEERPVLTPETAKIALLLCSAEMRSASARALWSVTEKFTAETGIQAAWFALPTPDDAKAQLDDIIAQGYTILVNNNGLIDDYLKQRAADYPDITFVAMEGWFCDKDKPEQMEPYPNLIQGTVRAEESAFIAGYLLASTSESGQIGMVNGTGNPPGFQMQAGFEAGVAYAQQESGREAAVKIEYVGNGFNRQGGKETAAALYNAGCDILFFCAGGETDWGALETAKALGKPCVTAGHTSYIAPDSVVAEVLKSKDPVITAIYQDLYYGRPAGGARVHGLIDGTAGLAKTALTEEFFGNELLTKLDALNEKIKAGEIVIPQTV